MNDSLTKIMNQVNQFNEYRAFILVDNSRKSCIMHS